MRYQTLNNYDNMSVRDKLWRLKTISVQTRLLAAEMLSKGAQYPDVTLREADRKNRQYLIYGGDPPDDYGEFLDEFFDEESLSLDETETPNTY